MKSIILVFIAILTLQLAHAQTAQPNYSRAKVLFPDAAHSIMQLASLGVAVDHGEYKKNTYFISDFSENEIQQIHNAGFTVEILIEDVVKHYAEQNKKKPTGHLKITGTSTCDTAKPNVAVPAHFQLGSYAGYFTYQEMLTLLDSMHTVYPNLISTKQQIGSFVTIEGRPIYWIRISNNPTVNQTGKPQILYTAVHHAREPGSLSATIFYLWYLLEHYTTDNEIKKIIDNEELYFVPCVNPDGYLFNQTNFPFGGGMWRKNRRPYPNSDYGTDLNRNYGVNWGYDNIGSSNNTSSDTYRGTAAFSEPETQAIKWFCENHQFQIALNYHTYQNDILYPWGHIPSYYTPDSLQYNAFGSFLTQANHYDYGTCNQMLGYIANGGSDDWMYGEQTSKPKTFGFTPEVGEVSFGFYPPSNLIIPYCKDNLYANINAAALLLPYANMKSIQSKILTQTSGYLHYNIKRLGIPNTGTFTVTATSLSSWLNISATPKVYNSLAQLQSVNDSISYTLNAATPNNQNLSYVLKINNGFYDVIDTVQVYYQKFVVITDQSTGTLAGWNNYGWGVCNTVYYSAPNSIKSSLNGIGNYPDNDDIFIETANPFDLHGATKAYLQFYTRWDIEQKYDYAVVEATDATLTNWQPLCGKYTTTGSQYQLADAPLYDARQTEWVMEEMDLSAYLGHKIKIRFELVSDASGNGDGFYFDDMKIIKVYDTTLSVKETELNSLVHIYPNPADKILNIFVAAFNTKNNYRGMLYDCFGRVVMNFVLENSNTAIDISGLSNNLYYLKLIDNENSYPVQKIELLR